MEEMNKSFTIITIINYLYQTLPIELVDNIMSYVSLVDMVGQDEQQVEPMIDGRIKSYIEHNFLKNINLSVNLSMHSVYKDMCYLQLENIVDNIHQKLIDFDTIHRNLDEMPRTFPYFVFELKLKNRNKTFSFFCLNLIFSLRSKCLYSDGRILFSDDSRPCRLYIKDILYSVLYNNCPWTNIESMKIIKAPDRYWNDSCEGETLFTFE